MGVKERGELEKQVRGDLILAATRKRFFSHGIEKIDTGEGDIRALPCPLKEVAVFFWHQMPQAMSQGKL
jgi:hypothetical protein